MHYIIQTIVTIMIPILMQTGFIDMVSVTPDEAAADFLKGLKKQDSKVMEKYGENDLINFLNNVQDDEKTASRINEALFENFSYEVEKTKEKNDVAVARVVIKSNDFSKVMDAYTKESAAYVMENIDSKDITDKENLSAKCLEMYTAQIEKAAESEETIETVVFIPMTNDGYYGWNVLLTDEVMKAALGNLEIPKL